MWSWKCTSPYRDTLNDAIGNLKPYYQNVRSLCSASKFNTFKAEIALCVNNPDIIVSIETWLNDSHGLSEISLDDYSIYRGLILPLSPMGEGV